MQPVQHWTLIIVLASLSGCMSGGAPPAQDWDGVLELVSSTGTGSGNDHSFEPWPDSDASVVVYYTLATDLFPGDDNDVCGIHLGNVPPWNCGDVVRDSGADVEAISRNTAGALGNGSSRSPTVSADGRTVLFTSAASNLVPGDGNSLEDVFLSGPAGLVRVTQNATGVGAEPFEGEEPWRSTACAAFCGYPALAPGGSAVVFDHWARNLVPGDDNGWADLFVWRSGELTRVQGGEEPDGPSWTGFSRQNADAAGSRVVFQSRATNLVEGPDASECVRTDEALGIQQPCTQVYLHDVHRGTLRMLSVADDGSPGSGPSVNPAVSADGRFVVFETAAANLLDGAGHGIVRVDLWTGAREVLSSGDSARKVGTVPRVDDAGATVVWLQDVSCAERGPLDVVVWREGAARVVTVPPPGWRDLHPLGFHAVSGDGDWLVFVTETDLPGAGDENGVRDVYRAPVDDLLSLPRNEPACGS